MKFYIYLYLFFVIVSSLSDKYFYKGQESENNKKYIITTYLLSLTWYTSLVTPILEHVFMMRYNLVITIIGGTLVLIGIIIRGVGIKTLGIYFSRDIETWNNQKIVKSGIYKYIRHPAYAGNILQIIGFPLVLNSYYSLILSLITVLMFIWRIEVEEKILKSELAGYKEYIKETKKILPKIW